MVLVHVAIGFFLALLLLAGVSFAILLDSLKDEEQYSVSIYDVIRDLIGTASTLTEEQRDAIENDIDTFDQLLFVCDGCSWWCSTDELNNLTDENLCDDCTNYG